MRAISLVTGHRMPRPDPEVPLLVRALAQRGIAAEIATWDDLRDWADVSLVVIRSPWDSWDHRQRRDEFLTWARRTSTVTILANQLAVLEWNSSELYLQTIMDAGVPTVSTRFVPRDAGLVEQRIVLGQHHGRVMIKPAVPLIGIGGLRVKADSERALVHLASAVHEGDVLVQPFVESISTDGETSLIYFAAQFSHAVRRTPAPGGYRVGEENGGAVAAHQPSPTERYVADWAMAQVPASTSYARVDLVHDQSGPVVLRIELIQPELFLRLAPGGTDRFADHLADVFGAPNMASVGRSHSSGLKATG